MSSSNHDIVAVNAVITIYFSCFIPSRQLHLSISLHPPASVGTPIAIIDFLLCLFFFLLVLCRPFY